MKKAILALITAALGISAAPGALLLQYTFEGTDNNGVSVSGYSGTSITRVGLGSAVYATDATTGGSYEGTRFLGTAISTLTGAGLTKPDTNANDTLQTHYVEFTITPTGGNTVNLNALDVILVGGSSTSAYLTQTIFAEVKYQIGSGTFVSAGSSSSDTGAGHTRTAVDRSYALGLTGISEAVTFRIFINDNAGGAALIAGIDNIRLDGSVVAIPEPSTYALLLGGVAALFGLRRLSSRKS